MMLPAILTALWFGILTALGPCTLATNIAAVSFIGSKSGRKKHILLAGFFYVTGRTIIYVVLAYIIIKGFSASTDISLFLQKYMNDLLGPILILLGLILLGWINFNLSMNLGSQKLHQKAKNGGIIWAIPLGAVFALSPCPVSAGLYFGGLLPLALKEQSALLLPIAYGIGTALPVILFAFIMAFASNYVATTFNKISKIEFWVRSTAGAVFILVGIYYSLIYIY